MNTFYNCQNFVIMPRTRFQYELNKKHMHSDTKKPKEMHKKSTMLTINNKSMKIKRRRQMITSESPIFGRYIRRVFRTLSADLSIAKRSIVVMDNFVMDLFNMIMAEAKNLIVHHGRKTLNKIDIESATKLVLDKQLLQHALAAMKKVMHNYSLNSNSQSIE